MLDRLIDNPIPLPLTPEQRVAQVLMRQARQYEAAAIKLDPSLAPPPEVPWERVHVSGRGDPNVLGVPCFSRSVYLDLATGRHWHGFDFWGEGRTRWVLAGTP